MSDKTPSSLFKHSLVLSTALAVVTVSASAEAYSRRNQLPSIEVHLEVLESLRQEAEMQARQQQMARQPSSGGQPQAMPFGRPSAPLTQPQVQAQPSGSAQYQPSATSPQPPRSTPVAQPRQPAATPAQAPATPKQGYATYQPAEVMDEPVAEQIAPMPTPVPVAKPDDTPAPAPKPERKAKPEPEPTPEPKPEPEPEPELEPMPEPAPMPEPDMEAEAEAEASAEAMPPLDIPDMPAPRKLDSLPEMGEMPALPEPEAEPAVEPDSELSGLEALPESEMDEMPALPEPEESDVPEMESTPLVPMPEIEDMPDMPEPEGEVETETEREAEPEMPPLPAAESTDAMPEDMDAIPPMPEIVDAEDETPADEGEMPTDVEPLEPLPTLEGMSDAEAQGEVSASEEAENNALVAPVPAPAAPKEEEGMFSGLMGQIKSMLGMEEEKPQRDSLVVEPDEDAPAATLPEGAMPMEPVADVPPLPEIDPQADAVSEEGAMETSGLPPLPDMEEDAPDTMAALPPLPMESVDEVPVSTTPNRSLPALDAIVSDDRRAEMTPPPLPEEPDEIEIASEPEAEPEAEPEVEMPEPEAEDTPMMSLEDMPELPAPPAPETDADMGGAEEMELASLPELPESPAETEVEADADVTATVQAPEVSNNGSNIRLFYGREDESLLPAMTPVLDELAAKLKASPDVKVKMESYAGSDTEQDTLAKRISLKRALGVRSYLIEAGVDSDRIMPPQALGSDVPSGPLERIDITVE